MRVYTLDRYSRRGPMAEGAKVHASSDEDAVAKARSLFPEYPYDNFKVIGVSEYECPYPDAPCICVGARFTSP